MQTASKFLVALVFAALTALAPLISGNGEVDVSEWVQVGIAVATAANIWIAANVPGLLWAKTAVAMVGAALSATVAVVSDGISPAEWINIILAALAVVAVYFVPKTPTTETLTPAGAPA